MNKVELNKYIESICTQIPLVNSFYTQDVYEIWNTKEVKYGSVSFYVQSSSVGENSTTWTGLIYYADRLLENKGNLDQIHTDAVNVITSVMNTIYSDEDIVSINFPTNVELFEQSFVDWLAGGYATIQIETDNSINGCGFGYIKDEGGCEGAINELNKEIEELEDVIDGKNEIIASKDEEIDYLREQLDGAIDGAAFTVFGQIGYNEENAEWFYNKLEEDLTYSKEIQNSKLPTGKQGVFKNDLKLVYMPYMDTSNVIWAELFNGCRNLRSIPLLDCGNNNNFYLTFNGCSSLTTIPQLDASKVTNMYGVFRGCSSLTTIPLLDTSKVEDMSNLFSDCTLLTTIPQLDTSKVIKMERMFQNCESLTMIPKLDTSNVTSVYYMFYNCTSLTTIPQLDTSKVVNANNMFYGTGFKLESLPLLDFSSVTSISGFFGYGNITTLTDLGGFTGLKINWTGSGSLKQLPNLTVQSLLNVFNTIADVTGLGGRNLEIGTINLAKLTDEQKQIAINKGWTLS